MSTPDGQLYGAERAALRAAVLERQPGLAFEVGTWYGGGSTAQIVSALDEIGDGLLITCDPDVEKYAVAAEFYRGHPHCLVLNGRSNELFPDLIPWYGVPDFVFFDGDEDPASALNDFKTLDAVMAPGAVFMMHDWVTPLSHKADLLKPYLEQLAGLGRWRIDFVLGPPDSVGLVKAVKL